MDRGRSSGGPKQLGMGVADAANRGFLFSRTKTQERPLEGGVPPQCFPGRQVLYWRRQVIEFRTKPTTQPQEFVDNGGATQRRRRLSLDECVEEHGAPNRGRSTSRPKCVTKISSSSPTCCKLHEKNFTSCFVSCNINHLSINQPCNAPLTVAMGKGQALSQKDIHELQRRLDRGKTCHRTAVNGWAGSSVRARVRRLRSAVAPNQNKGRSEVMLVDTVR